MQRDPVAAVEAFCAADLTVLDQTALQDRALLARTLARRLEGAAAQTLGELHTRYQGSVRTNPGSDTPPLFQSTQGWWRDAAVLTGRAAGAELRRAAVLPDLPLLAQAVTDGELTL